MKKFFILLLITIPIILTSCSNITPSEKEKILIDEAFDSYQEHRNILDESFYTEKETYKLDEEAIIYQNGEAIIGWKFLEVFPQSSQDERDKLGLGKNPNESNTFALKLEITVYNYQDYSGIRSTGPYILAVNEYGEVYYRSSDSIPFNDKLIIVTGETKTITFQLKNDLEPEKADKIYLRYYYIEDLLHYTKNEYLNYLQFELDISDTPKNMWNEE